MKYFTRERLRDFGNTDDEAAFLTGLQEWEEAGAAYRTHLEAIRGQLPRDLKQRLVNKVSLHDARVLSMYHDKDRFGIVLQPESDPQRLVILSYATIGEPEIKPDGLFEEQRSEPLAWLYDELDLNGAEGPRGLHPPRSKPTFRHSILLSNGWEIELRFRTVSVSRPRRIFPIVTDGWATAPHVSRSA
jgi:hypothetical protein